VVEKRDGIFGNTGEKSQTKINLVATVDTISPIITLDPNTPFALAEIYNKENIDVTSEVVMNGKAALVAH
jgi:hypothetical protein